MPRHRSLNLKKFIDSIAEPLIEEYFKQKLGGGTSFSLKTFDYDSVNKFLDTVQDEELKISINIPALFGGGSFEFGKKPAKETKTITKRTYRSDT